MFAGTRKFWLIALFTIFLIVIVNLAAWVFYNETERQLDSLLGRRLAAVAATAAALMPPAQISNLHALNWQAYVITVEQLDQIRRSDSLSEVFILNDQYEYLATTRLEHDSSYFLAALNAQYIDSLFFGLRASALPTATYRSGDVYLKSAFAPLRDTSGLVSAVLGVEADVHYFDSLQASRHNLWYATGLSLAGGLLFGVIFLVLQRRLNRAESRLFRNETNAYLGRMAAVVSHEIKNPLMIIRASAERLAKKHELDEASFVVEEVDRLNDIVTGYLDFARSGPDKTSSLLASESPQIFDVAELVESVKRHFTAKFPDEKIEWTGESIAADLRMTGYRRSLRQVLLNLLINGAEACRDAGRPIAVGIDATRSDHRICIRVVDRGPGISRNSLSRVFEPFFTTRTSGSGLGLYLSRKIIAEMNGEFDIDSTPDQGTTIIITLKAD